MAVSGANFTYVTDTLVLSHEIIPERLCMVIVPCEGDPVALVCLPEAVQVQEDSWIGDIRTYVEFKEDPIEVLAQLLTELGFGSARVGIESRSLAVAYESRLRSALPQASLSAADAAFDRARSVKTAAEIEILCGAATKTVTAIHEAFQAARPGDTEKEVADDVTARLMQAGATSRWIVLAAGRNTAINHPYPSSKQLTNGEILRIDVGAVFDGYQSDVGRTAVLGSATEAQQSLYQRLREIERETIAAARPGVRACDLYAVCRKAYEKRGVELKGGVVGHSIGVELHEHPVLHAGDETELKPRMLFNVEPATIDPQGSLYHIEDLLLVTEGEPEIITTNMDTERLFEIG